MGGVWRRSTDDLHATFRVEGCLDADELGRLGTELGEAARAGYRHVVLDLSGSCEQSPQQWFSFLPVVNLLAEHGTRLSVEGAHPDLVEGLRHASVEAQLRWLERQDPECFLKTL